MLSSALLLLHIVTMFTVAVLHSGPQVLTLAAARAGQPAAVVGIAGMYARTGRAVPPLGILGLLFGLGTALTGGFNLLAPWLLIAYALFALLVVYGGVKSHPYVVGLGEAVRDGRPNQEELLGRRLTLIVAVDVAIYLAIIADMVLKPFSS
ncbi:MAG: hypothetical protein ABI620_08480 [Chloroflexota bacterium]